MGEYRRPLADRDAEDAGEEWIPAPTGVTVVGTDGVKYTFTGPVKYREGAESLWND